MINLHNKKIRSETSSVLCLLAAVSITAVSTLADNSALTPFVLPWDDTSSTIVSAADMNSPIKDRWVRVSETGHLVLSEEVPVFSSTDIRSNPTVKEGERIRFMGMNMTFTAGFPPRDMASKVAGRLAKFGFNGVRFHHIDKPVPAVGIRRGQRGIPRVRKRRRRGAPGGKDSLRRRAVKDNACA